MKVQKTVLILFLLLVLVCSEENYKRVIHNTDPEAKCLDGSTPAVYVHQGS